jgi:hypothetical protein
MSNENGAAAPNPGLAAGAPAYGGAEGGVRHDDAGYDSCRGCLYAERTDGDVHGGGVRERYGASDSDESAYDCDGVHVDGISCWLERSRSTEAGPSTTCDAKSASHSAQDDKRFYVMDFRDRTLASSTLLPNRRLH